ncbi:DGQHR domain-containing protein [Leptospira weilii]|uniref:DGQHR domain-containing protein n=1 Tax=Leptospira weilii TaxID=28184 RepID=UPI001EF34249|nr:DGQHR domain-containing protein [Leptospira weilii]ULH30887.1 DGQHR domain-containing protein [Leptospira weilii]
MTIFKAIKFSQNGIDLFSFIATSKFIYENFEVSKRVKDKEQGYQRSFSSTRIKELSKHITKDANIIPNSILVNIDSGFLNYNENKNELELPDSTSLGLIIDGQHRVKGAFEGNQDFLLPVIATVGLSTKEQAKLFVTINKTQKGVPVSLYLDLLNLTEGEIENFDDESVPTERRAAEIARRLNEDEESPLVDLIRMTGEPGRGIALNEFVNRSKYLLDSRKGKLIDFGFEQQYLIFKVYFRAWKAVFIDQWKDESSQILKQTSFSGLLLALYDIFQLTMQYYKLFNTDNLIKLLNNIADFKFSSDNIISGGIKAQENVATTLINKLKSQLRETNNNINLIEE